MDQSKDCAVLEFGSPEGLVENLEALFEQGLHSDLTLECGKETFPAHRCILAIRSPVFKAMFKNEMVEQITSRVKIEDISPSAFRCFIRYLYRGKISREEIKDHGMEILPACQKYQVPELAKFCSQVLAELLTLENCLRLAEHACLYDATLLEKCKRFISMHWSDVIASAAFAVLAQKNHSLLVDLVRSKDELRELRLSFSPFRNESDWNGILQISRDSTVEEVAAKAMELAKLPSDHLLIVSGVVDHRIVKIYDPDDKVKELQGHLKVELVRSLVEGWRKRVVRFSHVLLKESVNSLQISYFGEPFVRILDQEDWELQDLKDTPQFSYLSELDLCSFLRRSNTDPYSPQLVYLSDNSRVLGREDEFIALVHPTCDYCSSTELHSSLCHLW